MGMTAMNSKQRWQDSSPVEQLEPHDASGSQGACLLSSVVLPKPRWAGRESGSSLLHELNRQPGHTLFEMGLQTR